MNRKMSNRAVYIFTISIFLAMFVSLLGSIPYRVLAKTSPVRVPADIEWVSTGIFLEEGQTVHLKSTGKAITGPINVYRGKPSGPEGSPGLGCGQYEGAPPPCALDDAPYAALIGRIGPSGDPFLIGGASSFTSPASGNLYLVVNDNLGTYSDNQAGFTVLFSGN